MSPGFLRHLKVLVSSVIVISELSKVKPIFVTLCLCGAAKVTIKAQRNEAELRHLNLLL